MEMLSNRVQKTVFGKNDKKDLFQEEPLSEKEKT